MRSEQKSCTEQQLDRACSSCARPDGANSIGGPGVDIGDLPLLSRSGYSSPRGKLTFEVKLRLAEETGAVLTLRAAEQGIPLGELLRLMLECGAHGVDAVANSQAERIRRVGALLGVNGSNRSAA